MQLLFNTRLIEEICESLLDYNSNIIPNILYYIKIYNSIENI